MKKFLPLLTKASTTELPIPTSSKCSSNVTSSRTLVECEDSLNLQQELNRKPSFQSNTLTKTKAKLRPPLFNSISLSARELSEHRIGQMYKPGNKTIAAFH